MEVEEGEFAGPDLGEGLLEEFGRAFVEEGEFDLAEVVVGGPVRALLLPHLIT
jgi:hypothetical protein